MVNLSQLLNQKLNELSMLRHKESQIILDIIELGLNNNNIPLATKYSEELLKLDSDNIYYKLKAAQVYSFSRPDEALNLINNIKMDKNNKKILNFIKAMSNYTKGNYCEAYKLFTQDKNEYIYKEISRYRCKQDKFDISKCKYIKDPNIFLHYASILNKEACYIGLLQLGKWGKNHFINDGVIKSSIIVAKALLMLGRQDQCEKEINNLRKIVSPNDNDFKMLLYCYNEAIGNCKEIYGNKNDCNIKGVNITVKINANNICKANSLDKGGYNILLTSDQGFGDNIMYYPFLVDFINKYGHNNKITLFLYKELFELFKNVPNKDNIIFKKYLDQKDTDYIFNQKYDYKGMISDCKAFANIDTLDQLYKLQEENYFCKESIKKDGIAICWRTDFRNPDSINKSFNLEKFLEKIDIDNISYKIYSVQKGVTKEEKQILEKYNIINLDNELNTFYDTCKILSKMKEVHTIDTSILHLSAMSNCKTICYLNRHIDCKFAFKPWLYRNLILKRNSND